ncbi:hypothetical protein KAR91_27615 [Candidatus Pacearchaeota archaeon]|nr:hypothetical protein [Candidatus Pacearchaeota archaeon]
MIFSPEQIAKAHNSYTEDGTPIVTREFLYLCNSGKRKCSPKLAKKLAMILSIPKEKIRPDIWSS